MQKWWQDSWSSDRRRKKSDSVGGTASTCTISFLLTAVLRLWSHRMCAKHSRARTVTVEVYWGEKTSATVRCSPSEGKEVEEEWNEYSARSLKLNAALVFLLIMLIAGMIKKAGECKGIYCTCPVVCQCEPATERWDQSEWIRNSELKDATHCMHPLPQHTQQFDQL